MRRIHVPLVNLSLERALGPFELDLLEIANLHDRHTACIMLPSASTDK